MSTATRPKSTVREIQERFDADVERFSNLQTGQAATIDSTLCMDLVAKTAAAATPGAKAALDIGCGAGNYSLKLREELPGLTFTLVDLSQPMLDRAKQRLGESAAELRQGDIRELKFPPGSFDIIVAAAVLHHLRTPREWETMFQNLHAWLRPGGGVWIFDMVTAENPAVQSLLWSKYAAYLEAHGGPTYREKVFAYIDQEDTPAPLTYQLNLLRASGFASVDILHKNAAFAAFGAVKGQ